MNSDQAISLVVVCDNHYLILLAALLKSIEKHHHSGEPIDLYIVGDQINPNNKIKLEASVNQEMFSIHWLDMKAVKPASIKIPADKGSYPLNIYMRLFIPYFIPAGVSKVIYMDVDMIMQEDISKLWHTDMADFPVAAVKDTTVQTIGNNWGGIKNYAALGLNPEDKYFNSGLLLINPQLWREKQYTQQIIDCINNNISFAQYPDQYGCNVIFADNWLELDSRWNFNIGAEETEKAYILHFVHRKPIYKSYNNKQVYQGIFYDYIKQTAWKNARPIGESSRYFKKIGNILQKLWR
jgi:lipopolysaccharide biosynthesis glycosyltransferase